MVGALTYRSDKVNVFYRVISMGLLLTNTGLIFAVQTIKQSLQVSLV